jgi:polysaccharide biosynthesis protein PslG
MPRPEETVQAWRWTERRIVLCAAGLCLCAALSALPVVRAAAEPHLFAPEISSGFGVQFTDNFLKAPDWRRRLDLVSAAGATVVRIDLNWPWTERTRGSYDWSLYDEFAAEVTKRRLRPLFILNRPNPLHGSPYSATVNGRRETGVSPPSSADEQAAFARWAAAAADRYRDLHPIWELWNEPDMDGFWPPRPKPEDYLRLARQACHAIKQRVPDAVVVGPAAAQMPTVWRPKKPLILALSSDPELLACLDAISLHTHRFGQAPETVSRDYAVLRTRYLAALPDHGKPIIDTEWGDSVFRAGISEETQARWLPRMYLTNLMEQVALTNWYCLLDVGPDDAEMEHRFGLVRYDGTPRPAFQAYKVMAQQIGAMSLREVIVRFAPAKAEGVTVLRFCDVEERCKLAAWGTEKGAPAHEVVVPGWRQDGPAVGHLGQSLSAPLDRNAVLRIRVTPEAQYIPVAAR